jgi:hypothetical protein
VAGCPRSCRSAGVGILFLFLFSLLVPLGLVVLRPQHACCIVVAILI